MVSGNQAPIGEKPFHICGGWWRSQVAPNHTEKCFPDMVIGWSFFLILLPKPAVY